MQRRFQLVCTVVLAAGLAAAQTSASGAGDASAGANASASQSRVNAGAQQSEQGSTSATHGTKAAGSADTKANSDLGVAVSGTPAQNGAANTSGALPPGTAFDVTLTKSVDAKKAKQGDEVVAKVNHDVKSGANVVIAKGSKLVGHVTDASAKTKESGESKLGIVFDKAISKGQEVPVHATIASIMAMQAVPMASASDDNMGAQSGGGYPSQAGMSGPRTGGSGGVMGGATRGVAGVGQAAGNTVGDVHPIGDVTAGADAATTAAAGAVQGLPGVTLTSAGDARVLSSTAHNVKLDGGTQLMLTVQ